MREIVPVIAVDGRGSATASPARRARLLQAVARGYAPRHGATRSASAGWRSRTACSCTAPRRGPAPFAPTTASSRSSRARKRLLGSTVKNPLLRGPARLAEAFAFLPRGEARTARGAAAVAAPARRSRDARRGSRCRSRRSAAAARRKGARDRAARPSRRRCSRSRGGELAAYHGAEHITIGTYEHGEERARRSTSAAARTSSGRCSSRRPPATCSPSRARAVPARRPGGRHRRRPRRVDRDVRLDAAPSDAPARARAREARPRVPAPGRDGRADTGSARGRRGGARTRASSSSGDRHPYAARPGDLRSAGREDARRLVHGRVLQPHAGGAARRRTTSRGRHAGLPEEALVPRRHGRGDRDPQAVRRRVRRPDRARALRRRSDRAVRVRADDRGRLHDVRASRDRVPRRARAPHADHDQHRQRAARPRTASR